MGSGRRLMKLFSESELAEVNNAVSLAEEMVCNYYKMSANQWLRHRYDVKTRAELSAEEVVDGPYAQIVRYACQKEGSSLGSLTFDFYKICLQDPAVLATVRQHPGVALFPFLVYLIVHELIHIVRFAKFYQQFEARPEERRQEEATVHQITREVLGRHDIRGIQAVLSQCFGPGSDPAEISGEISG